MDAKTEGSFPLIEFSKGLRLVQHHREALAQEMITRSLVHIHIFSWFTSDVIQLVI